MGGVREPREVIAATIEKLRDADAPTEIRVDTVRGAFGRRKLRRVEPVWRLGALCLSPDGAVFATGEVLVITEPTHPNHRSALAVERNELRSLALRAGVKVGQTIVLGTRLLDLDAPEAPLAAMPEGLGVTWTPGAAPIDLHAYLAERADLLIHPLPRS